MAKFIVSLEQKFCRWADVEIEAESQFDAEQEVLRRRLAGTIDIDWHPATAEIAESLKI